MIVENYTEKFKEKTLKIQNELTSTKLDFDLTQINEFSGFIMEPQLQVAVVGSIKAGKSSLLNALFGKEIASVKVTPETACLSIFKYAEKNNFKATFYNEEEWAKLAGSIKKSADTTFLKSYKKLKANDVKGKYIGSNPEERYFDNTKKLRQELEDFTSANSPVHFFIKKIEVGLSEYPLDKDIFFVDTPGLNDVIAYRSNITKDYIRKSTAVMVCVSSDALRNDEYSTIITAKDLINDNADKLIVVGTKIDRLTDPEEDWDLQQSEWQKHFDHTNLKHYIGVSSWIASIVQKVENKEVVSDDEVDEIKGFMKHYDKVLFPSPSSFRGKLKSLFTSDRKTIQKHKDHIYQKANVGRILGILKNGPLENPAEELHREIDRKYKNMCEFYHDKVTRNIEAAEEDLKLCESNINEQKNKITELEKQNRQLESDSSAMHDFMAKCRKGIQKVSEKLKSQIIQEIQSTGNKGE